MGYRREKEKAEKRGRKIRLVALLLVAAAVSALCIVAAFYPPQSWKYRVGLPDIRARKEGEMRLHFLDVGQGDCTIAEFPDGRTMIVDGGDGSAEHTTKIMRYINGLGIERFDFMLLTHPDSDHCGGLDEVLEFTGADTVFLPGIENTAVNGEYAAFCDRLAGTENVRTAVSRRYLRISSSSDTCPYSLVFLSPYRAENPDSPYGKIDSGDYTDGDLNDSSAVVWLDYAGTSALLAGDAGSAVEERLLADYRLGYFDGYGVALEDTEILKVSHHGSDSGTGEDFVRFLGTETAVISCGAGNVYGHPSPLVTARLAEAGAKVYRTDSDGDVVLSLLPDGTYSVET